MKKIAFVVLCTAAAATAWAADKSASPAATPAAAAAGDSKKMDMAMPDMKPAPEMEKMSKGMVGTWKCDGQSADMGKPSMHPIKSTMKMTSELGGHWIAVSYEEQKTKENPMPFSFKEMIGFDKEKKMFHRMFMDNMGGHAMFHASPASTDGKMEWNGEAQMGPMKMKMKDVITMKSDKEVAVEVTAEGQDGKWMPVANMTCKK